MIDNETTLMPLIPLRGLTVFPYIVISFDAGREKTVAAINEAVENDRLCLLVSQKDATKTEVTQEDLYDIGTVARIKQVLRLPGESVRVFAEGLFRGRVEEIVSDEEFFEARVTLLESTNDMSELETAAMSRKLAEAFEAYGRASGKISGETMLSMLVEEDLGKLCDTLAAGVLVNLADRQEILNCIDVRTRAERLLAILRRETEIQKIEIRIQKQVKSNVEKAQKEYYLREQLKVIHKELGEDADEDEVDQIKKRIDELPLPDEVRAKAEKELKRYAQLPSGSHEIPVVRNWLDWLMDLPWGKTTEDNFDLVNARKVLDDEHYGLEKVKDRFEFPVYWGCDLQTEHERFLTEQVFGKPVFVTDYPKEIKAFYMRQNDDGKTVAAMDLLVPGVGEIVGGSQREERLELLERRIKELGMKEEDYWWYLELRKYGGCKHAGFGLGFERILMYVTGMANIRDVIPYPRTAGSAEF